MIITIWFHRNGVRSRRGGTNTTRGRFGGKLPARLICKMRRRFLAKIRYNCGVRHHILTVELVKDTIFAED